MPSFTQPAYDLAVRQFIQDNQLPTQAQVFRFVNDQVRAGGASPLDILNLVIGIKESGRTSWCMLRDFTSACFAAQVAAPAA